MNTQHVEPYAAFLASKADLKRPLHIVCDASNGPAGLVARVLAEKVPALKLTLINDAVDPDFPAHGPDPSGSDAITDIAKKIIEVKADLGVIFDGDGDRAVFVDEQGIPIPPAVAGQFLMERTPGTHVADTLVDKVVSHTDPALAKRVKRSRVGRFFVSQAMRDADAEIGAEFSGHFFFKSFFYVDSALLTMIYMANLLSQVPTKPSEAFRKYAAHTVIVSKASLSKPFAEALEGVKAYLADKKPVRVDDTDGMTIDFGDSWINMRPSNTEPIVRVTAGGTDAVIVQKLAADFVRVLG